MLRLHGYAASINVRKVLWACAEIGLAYELIERGGGPPIDEPSFQSLTPFGMVPVIEDGDVVIAESNAILRYLATKHGCDGLWPTEPGARARIDMWMDWQASDFNNSWRYAFLATVRKRPGYDDEAAIQTSMRTFNQMVGVVERALQGTGGYVAGPCFTLADIPIGLSIHRWRSIPLAHEHRPHVDAYYERLSAMPGFNRFGVRGGP